MVATLVNGSMSTSNSMLFEQLTTPIISGNDCPRRTKIELDLILLAIEAIELGGSEQMLVLARELGLNHIIKNRMTLWRMRSTNPLRRAHSRRALSLEEAKALTIVGCNLARRLTVTIRQLLLAYQQLNDKQLPPEYNFRLSEYLDRFRAHFRSRMNPRRALIAEYQDDDRLNELAISLLSKLLFCTGMRGVERFWSGLFDGEVG
jgi:Protein of unknown function (DUF3038)